MRSFWNNYRHIIRPIFLIIGLLFFVGIIAANWQESQALLSQIDWLFFGISILIAIIDNIVMSVPFYWLIQKNGLEKRYSIVAEMFFFGQIAKYIPGRFWSFAFQTTYFDDPKASIGILWANLELTALVIWRNLILGLCLIAFITYPGLVIVILLIGLIGFIALVKIEWLQWVMHRVMHRFTRTKNQPDRPSPASPAAKKNNIQIGALFLCTTAFYLISSYVLFVNGFRFEIQDATIFIAFLSLAWIVGVLAFVMPAGIGVREAVFVFLASLLDSNFSIEALTTIAIIHRFWLLFLDVGNPLIGWLFRMGGRQVKERQKETQQI